MDDFSPVQGVFDFESGHQDGFANWRREQEIRLEAVRREWELPIGRRVRLTLKNFESEITGILRLVEHPATLNHRLPLRLRIDRFELFHTEIEQCIALDTES